MGRQIGKANSLNRISSYSNSRRGVVCRIELNITYTVSFRYHSTPDQEVGKRNVDSFHLPALFTPCIVISDIYAKLFQFFLPCGNFIVSWNIVNL